MKIGDIVIGKNNKLTMCVRAIVNGSVLCNYFDTQNNLHEEEYDMDDLFIVNP